MARNPRVLLNAQAFGYGPAAATAALARELAAQGAVLDYMGAGHTLDLQHLPPYAAVHDITGLPEQDVLARLQSLSGRYDALLTAMDFPLAALALRAGFRVAAYDALAWYWPSLPPVVEDETVLYVAQDYYGVRERIAAEPALRARAVIVPPIVEEGPLWMPGGKEVVVNLGGLHNPYWTPDDAHAYARLILTAVRQALPEGTPLLIATSRTTVNALGTPPPATRFATHRQETLLQALSASAYALMTPGLGNIYDAATTGVPTLWLPPANNTQALQADLLLTHGHCDARVDWRDLGLDIPSDAPEETAMTTLSKALHQTATTPHLHTRLTALLTQATTTLPPTPSRTRPLLTHFGHGGAQRTARAVTEWLST